MAGTTVQTNQFDELKDIVSKTLEKHGILSKAQAQLRKHVFEALSTTEQQNGSNYNVSPQIDENDINDKFALALIRDFLEYHHLDYTLSLMNTESQKKMEVTQNITRNEIASRLGLGAQKPDPEYSLLNQLVKKLFDADIFKPRNSTLSNDMKLKPRISNDSYRSTLDSTISTEIFRTAQSQQQIKDAADNKPHQNINSDKDLDLLEHIAFPLSTAGSLPRLAMNPAPNTLKADEIHENIDIDIGDLIDEDVANDANEEEECVDFLNDLLESSSNEDEEEQQNKDEELKCMEQMNKSIERLRQQASEFDKLKQETLPQCQSANSSQAGTEYEDDFGSDIMEHKDTENNNVNSNDNDDIEIDIDIEDDILEEIDEDIDEDIETDIISQSLSLDDDNADNIYCAKDIDDEINDEPITKDLKLENVADIIMDVKTEKIKYQL